MLPLVLTFAIASSFSPELPKHFLLIAEHTLRPNETAALAAEGVEIQQVLPDRRYIVRARSIDDVADDPRVASIAAIEPERKISPSAYREGAKAKSSARVRLVFHDDVTFADAVDAVASIGGTVDQPFLGDYVLPQRLVARIPYGTLQELAVDDRVFAIYGPPLKIGPTNAVAASMSHVTPLFSAPYNLSGAGVVASEFEFAIAAANHPEFGGRLITHVSGGDQASSQHATHVAGTIIAAGVVNAAAKGMAPAAILHEFDVRPDYPIVLNTKQNQLPPLGVVADNNSWGFQLGWQFDATAPNRSVWYGGEDFFGGYDDFYCAPYDKIARTLPTLFIHSAGNDADWGTGPLVVGPWFGHAHVDDNGDVIKGETFCYSQNGTGTDCPAGQCSAGANHCEKTKHPVYGPFTTIGPTASLKNTISVGAVDSSGEIASFSSRGPTHDGRIKPDLVAKGVSTISTWWPSGYQADSGTSMSSPVVTGIATLLTEQWRKSFGQEPTPLAMKTILIAGADDLGLPGPDYTFGFGLVNAQASADLIIADSNTGSRLRIGNISQGQTVEYPFTLTATAPNLRVVVSWPDPDVVIPADSLAGKTLVNDLDLRVIDASGNTVLPYAPDPNSPTRPAARGVNTRDNVEEVEIANAPAGSYKIQLTGTTIASGPTQQYALVANTALAGATARCTDPFEPNDTEATAFGNLVNRETLTSVTCSATDVDFYRIRTTAAGTLVVTVTSTDTALRVTLSGNGITPVVTDIPAGSTGSVSTPTSSTAAIYIVKVEPTGPLGTNRSYTLTPTFPTAPVVRRRTARH